MTGWRHIRQPRPRPDGGFTLLEIMVSLAILAAALIVLIRITTNNVVATNRAKLLTAATFLGRAKIVEIEDRVLAVGFVDVNEEDSGDFDAEGYPHIAWESIVERMELPTNMAQQAQQASTDMAQSSQEIGQQSPLQFMAGMMGGLMSGLLDPIRIGLQESVRRLTVRVYWHEIGRGPQSLEIVTFMTDPSRLDLAMGLGAGAGASTPTPGGQPGAANPGTPTPGGGAPQRPSVPAFGGQMR